ncbi:MAG: glycosyltransferase family 2 protein [Thermoleophilaceae bacterium]|nr:glycosyltransferase family 2 protein [Thermoleophilaceae bacterium]
MGSEDPQIAVAIVSWNTRDFLERCLRSLRPDLESGLIEVWVVDNDSHDGSADMVREGFPWAKLIESGANLGFGRAVNLAAAHTNTPWLVPANADIEMHPGTLRTLLEAGERHPRTGIVAPRMLRPEGDTEHSVHPFPSAATFALAALTPQLFGRALADRLCLYGSWDPEREREVPWAVGAFLLVRREAWNAVGGFPDGQWMYAEDLDLGWSVAERGWTTRYVPSARITHVGGASAHQAFGTKAIERWMDATYAWVARRRGRPRAAALGAAAITAGAVRFAVLSVACLFDQDRFLRRRDRTKGWITMHMRGLRATLGC